MQRLFLLVLVLVTLPTLVCAAERVRCVETDDAIVVTAGGKNVLRYNKATRESPAGIDAVYRRSGYIHPVYTPDGKEVTGDFCADHPHQHGLFFAWRYVTFEGRKISFWDQQARTGRTSHDKVISLENGDDAGTFSVRLIHEDLTAPGGPKPVLNEVWTVRVHGESDDRFVFDIVSVQTCASASPVTVPEYHYGGMAIRGNEQWFSDKGAAAVREWEKKRASEPDAAPPGLDVKRHAFLTSEGKDAYDGNHTRPKWVDMYGRIDGELWGIAVLCHPENFRAPQPVRLHPSKPYFCFSPMVTGDFEIVPGKPFKSRYRYVVHKSAPDAKAIDAEWMRFGR